MLPRLNEGQNQAGNKQQMAVHQLRTRMPNAEHERKHATDRCDDEYLQRPRLDIIEKPLADHFFLRLSRSNLLISSSSSVLIFCSSIKCTSRGLADPLKT